MRYLDKEGDAWDVFVIIFKEGDSHVSSYHSQKEK
jgi:hypothetical protein